VTGRRGPEDAWSEFVLAVFDVNALINRIGEEIVRPVGQTAARWHVLGRTMQPRTVAEIAAEMGHARQSVQRVADLLHGEGLIDYQPHPTDRRTKLAELTPPGRDVLAEIYRRQVAWFTEIAQRLDETALRDLTALLRGVAEILATHDGGPDSRASATEL
jgi:DNA-binding MarR family transcriptional regulator